MSLILYGQSAGSSEKIRHAAKDSEYRSLAFLETQLDCEMVRAFTDLCNSSLRHNRMWESLSLYGCQQNDFAADIIHCAVGLDVFAEIIVNENRLDGDSMPPFMPINDNLLRSLGHGLLYSNNLRKVVLSNVSLSNGHVEVLCRSLTKRTPIRLHELTFMRINFEEGAVLKLSTCIGQDNGLAVLALNRCDLSDSEIEHLGNALVSSSSLKEVRLRGNRCRKRGAHSIKKILSADHSSLRKLDLGYQHPSNDDAADTLPADLLANGLLGNKSLECLKLSYNNLKDSDVGQIIFSLWACHSLEELDLEHNKLTDATLEAFSSCNPCKLKRILLRGNTFTNAEQMIAIVQRHQRLLVLDVGSDWMPSDNRKRMRFNLDLNAIGRSLLGSSSHFHCGGKSVHPGLWAYVLSRCNKMCGDDPKRECGALFYFVVQISDYLSRASKTAQENFAGLQEDSSAFVRNKRKLPYESGREKR